MAGDRTRSSRDAFPEIRQLQTRWMDGDVYGHLNNTVHYSLFDTAVNDWLMEKGLLDPMTSETYFLVAESGCRYHAELRFPALIDVGIRIGRLGKSSVRWDIGLFAEGARDSSADGFFVHVNVERGNHRPKPISEATRDVMDALVVGSAP